MNITVPQGVVPGQLIQIQTPSGQLVSVAVPAGIAPGAMFQIQVSNMSNQTKKKTSDEELLKEKELLNAAKNEPYCDNFCYGCGNENCWDQQICPFRPYKASTKACLVCFWSTIGWILAVVFYVLVIAQKVCTCISICIQCYDEGSE